jgi:hypothetical protein
MLHPVLEENLHQAKHAFKEAKSENIIEFCENYLTLLNEFRSELHKFRGKIEINLQQSDAALFDEVLQKRREIHTAIMYNIRELNQTNALLNWLTSPNGYDTIETFNRLNYQGHTDWECRGGKVRFGNGSDADQIPIHEAVDIAIGLRCKEFIYPNVFYTNAFQLFGSVE